MESPDGTFSSLDYAIEARAGGTAHLRYVHHRLRNRARPSIHGSTPKPYNLFRHGP